MAYFNAMVFLCLFSNTWQILAQVDMSIVGSGHYQIIKCNAGQTDSMALKLQTLLPEIWNNLKAVIADATAGTSSNHGFSAFFKANDNIQTVQNVYQNMAAGNPVSVNANAVSKGRNINPLNLAWPGLVCVQKGDPSTLEHYLVCTTGDLAGRLVAGIAGQYVMLCPAFWTLPESPYIDNCPRVRRNTLTPNDESLVLNQQSALVHELAHLYGVEGGGQTLGGDWQEGNYEPYLLQDCVDLSATDSANNAQNYAYYYAGQFSGLKLILRE